MYYFRSKYQIIKVLIKVNYKQLKEVLVLKVKKLDLAF